MKDRHPGGALAWGVFIVGVQMLVYSGSVISVPPATQLLLAGAAGILILEFAVFVRAHKDDTLARVLAVPAGLLGVIPRYAQYAIEDYDTDTVFFGGMFVAVLLYAAFLTQVCDRQELQRLRRERAEDKARGYTFAQAEKFYDECVKNKITDLSRDADRQRLQLLVESKSEFKLPTVTPEALFQAGKEHKEQAKRAEQEKKWADERAWELKREAEEKKLAEMPPRAKRVYQMAQIAKAANERADAMLQASAAVGALSQSLQTKEKDPSISAGIASGIGGVVPAAMTASRIERENQDIRARNAAIGAQFDSTRAAAADAWLAAAGKATDWQKKAEAAKLKLTDDSRPAGELFAALTLDQPQTEQTKTGAVIVSLTAKSEQSYEVSGTQAVVDGAILADLCRENGEVAGLAHLCLPAEGLGAKEAKLSGICTAAKAGERYTVKLRPGNLFLIER